MHKEFYRELMLRFAKELDEAGVTDDMKKIVKAQYERQPNCISCHSEETVKRFVYQHEGYMICATTTVKMDVKKCK